VLYTFPSSRAFSGYPIVHSLDVPKVEVVFCSSRCNLAMELFAVEHFFF